MFRIAAVAVVVALFAPAVASADAPLTRAQIKQAQRALHVPADGRLGPRTRRAVKRLQHSEDLLPVDGRLHANVLDALGVATDDDAGAPAAAPVPGDVASAAVDAARTAIGTPYASGGTTLDGFDCSGLTQWAFKQAGVDLPRTSYDQYKEGDEVADGDVQAGDLVFFDTAGDGASHVGIATGPDTAISATSSKGVVEHDVDDDYWGDHFVGARRVGSEPTGE